MWTATNLVLSTTSNARDSFYFISSFIDSVWVDFAFIDADKENYNNYYEYCLQLLRPNGLIAIDNVLWSGKVADVDNSETETIAIRALNEKLYNDNRIDLSLLPLSDGVTLIRKK